MESVRASRRASCRALSAMIIGSVAPAFDTAPVAAGPRADRRRAAKINGKRLVRVARKYEGSKYVSGGASPRGFDCSGFTWYVVDKVSKGKLDIGRTVEAQWREGKKVSRGQLKPGDLVFFRKTDGPGLTHVGIFMGNDRFVHAENQRTGVVVSDLSSDYYGQHYAGARRL